MSSQTRSERTATEIVRHLRNIKKPKAVDVLAILIYSPVFLALYLSLATFCICRLFHCFLVTMLGLWAGRPDILFDGIESFKADCRDFSGKITGLMW